VLAAMSAALACAQALALIDQAGTPSTVNGTLEVVLPDWQWRRRTWLPHPACACGALAAGSAVTTRAPRDQRRNDAVTDAP